MKKVKTLVMVALAGLSVLSCGRGSHGGQGGQVSEGTEGSTTAVLSEARGGQGGRGQNGGSRETKALRAFPNLTVPGIYTSPEDIFEYSGEHYWDAFFAGTGTTDTTSILGVRRPELEQAVANYISILNYGVSTSTPKDREPLRRSQKMVGDFFQKIEATRDTLVYLGLTEIVQRYLYDPNSPLRDEDLYLPFAKGMAASLMTSPDMKKACRREAGKCAINQFGEKAPDFKYRTLSTGSHNLWGIRADWTILFFSNPGCSACKTIVESLVAAPGFIGASSSGKVAVLSMYVDEEVDKWRDYAHNYPAGWIVGYDYTFSLRDGNDYDIRAIPSVYLLDSEKRIILKDAPVERLVAYLSKVI